MMLKCPNCDKYFLNDKYFEVHYKECLKAPDIKIEETVKAEIQKMEINEVKIEENISEVEVKHKIVDFPSEDPLKIEDLNQESILQSKAISSVVVLTDFNPQDKIKTESFNIKHIRVKCQYCDKLFNEQDLLIKHINNEHCHKFNLCNEEFI